MGELYRLTFSNDKQYIGISSNGAFGRFLQHSQAAIQSDALMYRAWRKYGEPALKVLAIVEDLLLHETEIKAIALYGTFSPGGYNLTRGGEGALGCVRSLETRIKLSVVNKGRFRSPESRARISAAHKGIRPTAEALANMAAAQRNRSPESRAKASASNKGQIRSPETRAKLSLAARNRSAETIAKISAALKVRGISPEERAKLNAGIRSAESRAKISASRAGVSHGPRTPEEKAKISAGMIRYRANQKATQQKEPA